MHTKILTRALNFQKTIRIIIGRENQNHATTTPFRKLNLSYCHHASPFELSYKTLSQSFDETAAKYSDHECFIFRGENKRYTFKTFKYEIDCIAAALLDLGFEKNDRIAVWLPNTSQNAVMSYATSKLGLIKVNINPAYVERELEYCLNKVGCKGILLSPFVKSIDLLSIFRRLIPEIDQHSVSADELKSKTVPTLKHVILTSEDPSVTGAHSYVELLKRGAKLSHDKITARQASIDPESPVAIFYTSGTTGEPKAATLTNFSVLNSVRAQFQHLGKYYTRLCVPVPMFHVVAEIGGTLNTAVGKCQVIYPAILPDAVATMQSIQDEKCTALIGPPIIFRDVLMHQDRQKYDLSSLVFGATGATPVHVDFMRQITKELKIPQITQLYGMSETSGVLLSGSWASKDHSDQSLSSLGRCMQGMEVKIVDKSGQTVPIGEHGEIWARSYSIMHGYYGEPEKTRETITPSGWLKTGDEGKMDENGYFHFVGRQKEMISRGGVKIYPIEIEKVIMEHPSVSEAQVFSIPDERHGEEVAAWIKLKPNEQQCRSDDIKKFLKNKLAFFKIPKYIRIVDKFIMTPTGKVQKFKMAEITAQELNETNT